MHTQEHRILICAVLLYDLSICHAMTHAYTHRYDRHTATHAHVNGFWNTCKHTQRITDKHARCGFVLSVTHWYLHTRTYSHTHRFAGVKIWNMPVPLRCTLTLKLRITQGIIPVYVCVSVCLPVCLSIHPFILLSSACLLHFQLHLINTSLLSKNTRTDTNSPWWLFAASSLS